MVEDQKPSKLSPTPDSYELRPPESSDGALLKGLIPSDGGGFEQALDKEGRELLFRDIKPRISRIDQAVACAALVGISVGGLIVGVAGLGYDGVNVAWKKASYLKLRGATSSKSHS